MMDAQLRPDLGLFPGHPDDDGAPSAILHDPFFGTYDRLEWREREIVLRLRVPIDEAALAAAIAAETTVGADETEVRAFVDSLRRRGLLRFSQLRDPAALLAEDEALAKRKGIAGLFAGLLFFRITLWRPDAFLRQTLWIPRLLSTAPAKAFGWLIAAAAVAMFIPRASGLGGSAAPFIAWRGAVWLTIALAGVKFLHELGHAYAAAVRGVRVRGIGVALLLFAPIPFANVTDAWQLSARERLAVDSAGVRTELFLAAAALLGWSAFPPGPARDVCLVLCTASLASTLLANLNPGMRFDGYYILSDLLGIDSLQFRGTAYARYFYRSKLLGLPLPDPEPRMRPLRKCGLLAYAVYAYVYRIGLYFGLALLVYNFFPKAIGAALFVMEAYMLLVRPLAGEVSEIASMTKKSGIGARLIAALLLFAALAWWFAAPMPRRLRLHAVATADSTPIYVPASGAVRVNNLRLGARLPADGVILEIDDPLLDLEMRRIALEQKGAELLFAAAFDDERQKPELRSLVANSRRLDSVSSALAARQAAQTVRARAEATVIEESPFLPEGVAAQTKTYAGRTRATGATEKTVVAYIPEDMADDVIAGSGAWFVPDCDPGSEIPAVVTAVMTASSRVIGEPALTEPGGGGIVVVHEPGVGMTPASPVYRIEAAFNDGGDAVRDGQTGRLKVYTRPRSLALDSLRWLGRVLLRESGF